MATNLAGSRLIERALQVSGERTKKARSRAALEVHRPAQQERLIELMGKLDWDDSFDHQGRALAQVTLLVTSVWSLRLGACIAR